LVACVAAFAAQKADMNVSLTAVGMLWAAVDFVEKRKGSAAAPSPEAEGGGGGEGGSGRAWDAMLDELGVLAVDTRPDVRNCAVNTMVSAIGANGNHMSPRQWESALAGAVVPLVVQVDQRALAAAKGGKGELAAVHEVRSRARASCRRAAEGALS
jgi:hypothetical protein